MMNMRKNILLILFICLGISITYVVSKNKIQQKKRLAYITYINNHPYSKRKILSKEELKKIPKKDRPDLAFEQDFLRTMNPETRTIPRGKLLEAIDVASSFTNDPQRTTFTWESRGPKEVAGRARAMMFDPNDNTDKKVFAGGVGGGIWMNPDITDATSPWVQVSPNMSNFAISSMTYDPVNTMNLYAGTGEGWGNSDAIYGGGMWKSTDGGATWSNLPSTIDFEYIYDIVVRNESGVAVIYAIMRDLDGVSSNGTDLFRSTDGGTTWTNILADPIRDLEIAADNTLWAGDAVGNILSSSDGITWTNRYTSPVATPRRVEIATAPSDANVVYALIANGNAFGEFVRTSNAGTSWTSNAGPNDNTDNSILAADFTRGQAWYDFIAAVHPGNSDEVYIGGVNSFKTENGGTSWTKISSWSDGRDASVSYSHADQHNIIFRPNHNDQFIMANDGGIFYAPDLTALPTSGPDAYTTGILPRNLNFNITQFYSAAIDPVNPNAFIGGTQDNGTNLLFEAGFSDSEEIWGGDGGFCFIDQTIDNGTDGLYRIVSFTGNTYYLLNYTVNPRIWIRLNSGNGSFINPADYDDVNNVLYSYEAVGTITETTLNADNAEQGSGTLFFGNTQNLSIPELATATTHIRVSPYNEDNRAVFFGTNGNVLIKRTADGTVTNISNSNVFEGAISCVEIGASDDELLLTYSNYGVESVWYSTDGGTTWINKEANLPDMPVRWAMFNPLDRKEVILATEVGIWKTSDITATRVVWEPASTGMGNVRVDMLQYRESDQLVLAATHGRGMFTSNFSSNTASVDGVLTDNKVFTVYPTISNGNFTLQAKNTLGKTEMNMYDITGKKVFQSALDFNANEKQDISVNLNAGVYIIHLIDENNQKSSTKMIIE